MHPAAVILVAQLLLAQPPAEDVRRLLGASEPTYKRLAEADRKRLAGNAAEAAEELQKVVDEAGDDLVSADGKQYRPARRVAQGVLVQLPPAVLRGVRDRIDGPAWALVEAGKRDRDPRPLKAAVDRYFPARPTEEALLLLGELAFERGEFRTAERHWRRLLPADDPTAEPSFPDPTADPALVRAKAILAVIFQGDRDRAAAELAEFTKKHPTAAGKLAGRTGPLAAALKAVFDARPHVGLADAGDGSWTGFAGPPTRNARATGPLPRYWPSRPTWEVTLPRESTRSFPPLPGTPTGRTPAYHPVVLAGRAFVADAARVFEVSLQGGPARLVYHLARDNELANPAGLDLAVPPPPDSDYPLTVADGRLFARVGTGGGPGQPAASWLVSLNPDTVVPGDGQADPVWRLAPPTRAGTAASWEAAPVWADGRLYAAYTRLDGTTRTYGVACYDDPPGRPVWQTDVASAPAGTTDVRRPEPLTLAGDTLIYCTHAGTIAAVDVRTGKPVWALRYPRPARGWPGPPPQRDLCPAVADNGRVFAAPHDSDQLFALDAGTGRVLWQAGPLAVDQLLGVTRGKLIATVSRPTPGIRGLDVATGSDRGPSGWATHDDAALRSFGRGLVADNLILWPTGDSQNAVLVLDPHTGRPAGRPPLRPPAGNLAFADGVLLVGTPAGLAGYVTDAFRGNPAIPPPPSGDDRNRAVDLINLAERALERGDMKSAEATLRDLIRREFPTTWRVRAAGRLLSLQPPGGGRDAADRFLVSLGQKAEFADGWLNPADGPPARLRELVRRHFGVPDPPPRSPPPVAPAATPPPAELDPQLPISKTVTFPTVCRPLLAMDGGPDLPGLRPDAGSSPLLFVTDGPRVLAYHPGAASPGWTTPLPDGLVVDRARVVGPALYLVGRHGAAKLSAADGKLLWWFAVPDTDPLPGPHPRPSPGINSYPLPALADPAVCGRRLIARLGDGHLVGLDLVTGSISWVLDGRGRNGYSPYPLPSVPRFTHLWAASATLAVARTSAGERVLLDPDTGAVKDVSPTSPLPWAGPPARLANGFVVADGAAELTALSGPETGLWAADFGREASLTGKPPQLLSLADGVLAAVSRNHGVELERVQAAGGTRPWPDGPTFLSTAGGDLSAAAVGESLLYVPVDGTLTAVRLADGRHAWSVPLPGDPQSTWQVRVGRTAVFARPTRVPEGLEWAKAAGRLARWPAVWRLPALAAGAYDAWATGTVPLLAFDPDSGRRLARLDLPAAGGEAAVSLGRHPVVVTARRAYWLKPS